MHESQLETFTNSKAVSAAAGSPVSEHLGTPIPDILGLGYPAAQRLYLGNPIPDTLGLGCPFGHGSAPAFTPAPPHMRHRARGRAGGSPGSTDTPGDRVGVIGPTSRSSKLPIKNCQCMAPMGWHGC